MTATDQVSPLRIVQAIAEFPQLGPLIAAFWSASEASANESPFFATVCEVTVATLPVAAVQVFEQQATGDWKSLAASGPVTTPSAGQLERWFAAEQTTGETAALLISLPHEPNRLVILHHAAELSPTLLERLGKIINFGLRKLLEHRREQDRARRLKAMLTMVESWHRTADLVTLLNDMAHCSTEFFQAERASIFLWDRPKRQLVGRPALGVPDGKLVVPDDKGVVGAVVQSGQPRRVDAMLGHEVNREIDRQLEFHTQSLLCVPLLDHRGKVFGAFELINKQDGNFTAADETGLMEVAVHAAAVLESSQQIAELTELRDRTAMAQAAEIQLIGDSPVMADLRKSIQRVAKTNLPVLVLGENGTGKEVVSRLIHFQSARRGQPLVAINCAALPETLLESELFGHEKGAFTGANETKPGKFELASGGTLFLDEIGDMSLPGQAKLLRVLENQLVTRLGGQVDIQTDVRVIAATNQDLPQLVKENRFREDLFYRLDVVSLNLPPLRERGDDILLLAERFLAEFARKARRHEVPMLSSDAKSRLLDHTWPGNIRELRNTMERIAFLCDREIVTAEMLPLETLTGPQVHQVPTQLDLSQATERFQADFISYHLNRAAGNMSEAARRMGLHRSNLHRKMKQLGLLEEKQSLLEEN